jgi:hypothetical protein
LVWEVGVRNQPLALMQLDRCKSCIDNVHADTSCTDEWQCCLSPIQHTHAPLCLFDTAMQ